MDWPSFWLGFATPFMIVLAGLLMFGLTVAARVAWDKPCSTDCCPCHVNVARDDRRIIRFLKVRIHLLQPSHRRNHRIWRRTLLDGRGRSMPPFLSGDGTVRATFDRSGRPVRIMRLDVHARFGNDILLLDRMLVRLPAWRRDGDLIRVPDPHACQTILLNDIGSTGLRDGMLAVTSKDGRMIIRIPMPWPIRTRPGALKWAEETGERLGFPQARPHPTCRI